MTNIPQPRAAGNLAMPAIGPSGIPTMPPPPPHLAPLPENNPVDLWGNFDPPGLPTGLLPPIIDQFANVLGAHMGADRGGLAMAALATCATAIPDRVAVRVKQHDPRWHESARIWVALIGQPSTKKSPIMNAAMQPLAREDAMMMRAWLRDKDAWAALPKDERLLQPEPLQKRLRLSDTTVEAAQDVLRGSVDGLMIHSDELSGWFGSMERYSGGGRGAAADRAFWLQAFNGGEFALNRVGRGSVLLPNLSASILGGIQPDAIRKIAADAVDDGLLQRFFPIILRTADLGQDAPIPDVQAIYEYAVGCCRRAIPPNGTLQFDYGAHAIRREMEQRHHRLIASEAVNPKLAAHIGKLDGLFARLCVVFHVVDHCFGQLPAFISEATAKRVSEFMRLFLLPHAAAFYSGILGLGDDHDRLQSIAAYILAHRLDRVDNRTVQRGDRSMRKIANRDVQPLLQQLAALNWLAGAVTNEARPSSDPAWIVNPMVHQLYAERAEREKIRREIAKAALTEIFAKG